MNPGLVQSVGGYGGGWSRAKQLGAKGMCAAPRRRNAGGALAAYAAAAGFQQ